ncbi:hypothetical protein AB1L88_04580 [Tautonia sp. JC769]|uniref:c-type cytochrome n=1 Tax=Tautonia sp. JC769 TaxID=3232135 RepID=UPI00345A7058
MTPPDLSQVGAKLKPEALDLAIRGEAPTARPWLSVRMPRFDFEPGEAEAIASYLRDHDRVDPAEREQTKLGPMHPGPDVGITLLGRQGFGCLSCHVLDGKIPPGGEAETLGPDLALAHQRMSRPYFDRWLSDPQRILPGTAMPQFLLPAPGIEGTISEQLGAVWEALGNPGLVENASTSTRQFLERQGDRALVVRDMILPDNAPLAYYPRGLAIGLKGDRSVLFDTDQLIWVQWWDQGFLSRTKEGRLWEWHPEGRTLWVARDELPPILLQEPDGRLSFPELRRDRFGTFQELTFEGNGVRLHYDLHASSHPGLRVTEVIEPTREGWLRRVEVQDVPDDLTPVILAVDGQTWALQDDQGATNREGTIDLRIEGPASWIKASGDPPLNDAILVKPVRGEDGTWIGTLRTQVHPED